ncbi:MAG: RlmE family RNA methyltransferase [Rickettsiales bacterium]|jgi:23S rRNA (uridine2552-2'-O)-methyltransferase|nr:RlmE family RNA methyltransferase [Rickettsiales bacterium]
MGNDLTIRKRFKTNKVKTAKNRKISSTRWLERQLNDPFVLEAKNRGYRSRAAFKIIEIDNKFKIFRKGHRILDLGSAPGGWSQIAGERSGSNNILAIDISEMEPLAGVKFVQQDFLAPDAEKIILESSDNKKYNIVMSDMAANTTGDKKTDHLRTLALAEGAFNFAIKVLVDNGTFVCKIFQGGTEKDLMEKLKKCFDSVKHFKPNSSRKDSVEMYVVASGFHQKYFF